MYPQSSSSKLLPDKYKLPLLCQKKVGYKSKENRIRANLSLQQVDHTTRPCGPNRNQNMLRNNKKQIPLGARESSSNSSLKKIRGENWNSGNTKLDSFDLILSPSIKNGSCFLKQLAKGNKSIDVNESLDSKSKFVSRKRIATQNCPIFNEVKGIVDKKTGHSKSVQVNRDYLSSLKNKLKFTKIPKKIEVLSPQSSIIDLNDPSQQFMDKQFSSSGQKLKHSENYHKWLKIHLNSHRTPRYEESTYELETERLSQLQLKNQSNFNEYLQVKEELHNMVAKGCKK